MDQAELFLQRAIANDHFIQSLRPEYREPVGRHLFRSRSPWPQFPDDSVEEVPLEEIRRDRRVRMCALCDDPIDAVQRQYATWHPKRDDGIDRSIPQKVNIVHSDATATKCTACGAFRHGTPKDRWRKRYGAAVFPRWHQACRGGSMSVAHDTKGCKQCIALSKRRANRGARELSVAPY